MITLLSAAAALAAALAVVPASGAAPITSTAIGSQPTSIGFQFASLDLGSANDPSRRAERR